MSLSFQAGQIETSLFQNWKHLSPARRNLCPLRELMDRVGDKWSILILHCLEPAPKRFNALKREIEGISQRMLTVNLRSLERDGLITRNVTQARTLHVDYALTAMGIKLIDLTSMMVTWAFQHEKHMLASRAAFDMQLDDMIFHDNMGGLL